MEHCSALANITDNIARQLKANLTKRNLINRGDLKGNMRECKDRKISNIKQSDVNADSPSAVGMQLDKTWKLRDELRKDEASQTALDSRQTVHSILLCIENTEIWVLKEDTGARIQLDSTQTTLESAAAVI